MTRVVTSDQAAKEARFAIVVAVDASEPNLGAESVADCTQHGGENASGEDSGAIIEVLYTCAG